MTAYIGNPDYVHGSPSCTGILLTNLGTPDAPTPAALRRYLGEFLADPRVVEFPRPLWLAVLHGVVLRVRPRRAAHAYRKVWSGEGSPLLAISRHQATALQEALTRRVPGPVKVVLGMRYGNPSLPAALDALRQANARRILVLPLYPQYSATTTASTFDAVAATLRRWRDLPDLRFVSRYHDRDGYVRALAASIRQHWASHSPGERLLFSFHGLPKRYLHAGDPYHCECHKTARLVAEALELPPERWQLAFQSRFGREEWLQPYTDATLRAWAEHGIRHVDVVCPGFAADCLETLEEIAIQNRELFHAAGGEAYHYIPALNARPEHIDFLADLVLEQTQGWSQTAGDWDDMRAERDAAASRARALALGAAR